MRKDALATTMTTLVISIFGAFLRWLQTMNAFEPDTGLVIPGAATSIVYLVYSVLAAAAMAVLAILWLRRCDGAKSAEAALAPKTAVPSVIGWGAAAITAIGCVRLMFTAGAEFPTFTRIFAAAGIVMAPCLPLLFPKRGGDSSAGGRFLSAYVTVFACFWLVYCYRTNAENPVVWLYGVDILAVCGVTAGYYYVCAYHYGKARPMPALIAMQLGVYFSLSALFGTGQFYSQALFLASAVMLLTFEYLLVSNLKEKKEEEPAPEA